MLFRQYEGGSAIKLEKLVSSRLGIVVDIAHTDEDEKGSGERRKEKGERAQRVPSRANIPALKPALKVPDKEKEGNSTIHNSNRSPETLFSKRWLLITALVLVLHIAASITTNIFIIPHIHCASFPTFIRQYCPDESHKMLHLSARATQAVARRKNFASQSHGAKVLQQYTTVGLPRSWFLRLDIFRSASEESHPLAGLALNERMDVENCWEFNGSQAMLAIRLSDCIAITHISMDQLSDSQHIPYSPRDIVVWGVVEGHENIARTSGHSQLRRSLFTHVNPNIPPPLVQGYALLPLATFRYDASISGQQYFNVFDEISALGIDFGVILFQINGNWGSSTTILCNLGVYGFRMQRS
ncbi:hypothetical protein PHLCEN_2v4784 [Hermanssonia centrifuga]|uniref:SUN domain-containing protein n=1 Tax=Hermanssonia centrifuga TaxID=98765 RepID=A0A2R6PJ78_9APHY|nr:hypothetical protein PHLCEN_2v4784 [Hermanssonia centrifuga]